MGNEKDAVGEALEALTASFFAEGMVSGEQLFGGMLCYCFASFIAICLSLFLRAGWGKLLLIVGLQADGLVVISEAFAEKGAAAYVGSVLWDLDAEGKIAVVIQIQIL